MVEGVESVIPHETVKLEKPHVPVMLVMGQGPIKPVLLLDELTPEQKVVWDTFTTDPLHHEEPEFRVIGDSYAGLEGREKEWIGLNPEEQKKVRLGLVSESKKEWQKTPRFALNKYGRTVAMAAGNALMEGLTDKLILCGGKTMPGWMAKQMTAEQTKDWPTEAGLMQKYITNKYRKQYEAKHPGKKIEDVVLIEAESTMTVQNIANVFKKYGDELRGSGEVGFLTADFHLERATALVELLFENEGYTGAYAGAGALAQLEEKLPERRKKYRQMLKYLREGVDETGIPNTELQKRIGKEARIKGELADPRLLAYWGLSGRQTGELQEMLFRLTDQGADWGNEAKSVFSKYNLDFTHFTNDDIENLQMTNKASYDQLKQEIAELNNKYPVPWKNRPIDIKEIK